MRGSSPRSRLAQHDRNDRYRRAAAPVAPLFVLVLTLLLSICIGVLHNRLRARNRMDPILASVRTVLYPAQTGTVRAEMSLGLVWSWLFDGRRLADENARLRKEIARLRQENQSLHADADSARRLRAALQFVEKSPKPLVAAEVLGLRPSPLFDNVLIARGARDGVRVGQVVRTPEGLFGLVSDVAPLSSTVMLMTDRGSGIGGSVVRDGKVIGVGIVRGAGPNAPLEVVYLSRESDVRVGDRVVSSGLGGVVPADIPIGTVIAVTEDRTRFLRGARLKPAVAYERKREVFLIP